MAVIRRDDRFASVDDAALAHIVSAIMFLSMAATTNIGRTDDEIAQEIPAEARQHGSGGST